MPLEQFASTRLIEGVDSSGKTTVADIIARDLNIKQINRLTLVNPNPHITYTPGDPMLGVYLARSIIYDYENWKPLMVEQLQVSLTNLRSAAHEAGFPSGLGPIFDELLKYAPRFNSAFLLTASVQARKERVARRPDAIAYDNLINTDPKRALKMDQAMIDNASRLMGATIIDTSFMSPMEVAETIKRMIGESKPSDQITGVRISQRDIRPEEEYIEKELRRYQKFLIRTHKVVRE